MPHSTDVNSFNEQNTQDAAGKGNKKKKRLPQPIRGIANFLNEEQATVEHNFKKLRKLKKNPKY